MADSTFSKGIRGACPKCGEGQLFEGLLKYARGCEACGLSYDSEDTGDGPAIFIIFIIGIFVFPFVFLTKYAFKMSTGLTLVIWMPIITMICLYLMRLGRGIMFAQQYKHKAGEAGSAHVKAANLKPSDLEG